MATTVHFSNFNSKSITVVNKDPRSEVNPWCLLSKTHILSGADQGIRVSHIWQNKEYVLNNLPRTLGHKEGTKYTCSEGIALLEDSYPSEEQSFGLFVRTQESPSTHHFVILSDQATCTAHVHLPGPFLPAKETRDLGTILTPKGGTPQTLATVKFLQEGVLLGSVLARNFECFLAREDRHYKLEQLKLEGVAKYSLTGEFKRQIQSNVQILCHVGTQVLMKKIKPEKGDSKLYDDLYIPKRSSQITVLQMFKFLNQALTFDWKYSLKESKTLTAVKISGSFMAILCKTSQKDSYRVSVLNAKNGTKVWNQILGDDQDELRPRRIACLGSNILFSFQGDYHLFNEEKTGKMVGRKGGKCMQVHFWSMSNGTPIEHPSALKCLSEDASVELLDIKVTDNKHVEFHLLNHPQGIITNTSISLNTQTIHFDISN